MWNVIWTLEGTRNAFESNQWKDNIHKCETNDNQEMIEKPRADCDIKQCDLGTEIGQQYLRARYFVKCLQWWIKI